MADIPLEDAVRYIHNQALHQTRMMIDMDYSMWYAEFLEYIGLSQNPVDSPEFIVIPEPDAYETYLLHGWEE